MMSRDDNLKNKVHNRITKIILCALFLCGVLSAFVFTREVKESDLFIPRSHPCIRDGQESGFYRKNIEMTLRSGKKLRGWLLRKKRADDYFIYYYGNGESVYTSGERMTAIANLFNINVVCFDYQGYSYSEGNPSFDNMLNDSLEIYDFLGANYFKKNSRIFAYGQSLGTIPALNTAVNRRVDGCVLEASFTTADRAIFEMGWNNIPFPVNLFVRLRPEEKLSKRKPQQIDQVRRLNAPVLFVHCATDNLFPLYMAKEMLRAAGSSEKSLTVVHGCRHYPLPISVGTEEYVGMKVFLDELRPARGL
jgi:pimeloyl-ACP methyl ester carboxylesterase